MSRASKAAPSKYEIRADEEINQLDRQYAIISTLTPLNLHEEREAFFADQIDNPTFRYRKPKANLKKLRKQMRSIEIPDTAIGSLLKKKREDSINKMEMLLALDSESFTDIAKEIYGVPDKSILKEARDLLTSASKVNFISTAKKLTSEEVADKLKGILKQYGLKDWTVETTHDTISGVVVVSGSKKVLVHANAILAPSRIGPVITHEIETHVLTAINGRQQPLIIFASGFAGSIRTQEGLAGYNVWQQYPELAHRPARFWARNTIAVDLALRQSFREVYDGVRALGFSEHFAFLITTKTKRGYKDTSKAGAFTKDYLYLAGLRDVRNFVENGGDLRDLYIGKININDLEMIRRQPWLVPPKTLPVFLEQENKSSSG